MAVLFFCIELLDSSDGYDAVVGVIYFKLVVGRYMQSS